MGRRAFVWTVGLLLGVGVSCVASATSTTITLSSYPAWITTGDVNADGHVDIIVGSDDMDNTTNWVLSVNRGQGNGSFSSEQITNLSLSDETYDLTGVGMGTIGGDTYKGAFFIVQNQNFAKVYRSHGNGDGTFGTKTGYNTGDNPPTSTSLIATAMRIQMSPTSALGQTVAIISIPWACAVATVPGDSIPKEPVTATGRSFCAWPM